MEKKEQPKRRIIPFHILVQYLGENQGAFPVDDSNGALNPQNYQKGLNTYHLNYFSVGGLYSVKD